MPGGGQRRERNRSIVLRELAGGERTQQHLMRAMGYDVMSQYAVKAIKGMLCDLGDVVKTRKDKANVLLIRVTDGRQVCPGCNGRGVVSK